MANRTTTLLGTLAILALPVAMTGCQTPQSYVSWERNGIPNHDQPHQQWWNYKFVYHPEQQVYFEPYTKTYYWYEASQWEQGPAVPDSITLNVDNVKVVHLQQQTPYVQHASVVHWMWAYGNELPGSVDSYHGTPEAIERSEYRASIRATESLSNEAQALQGAPALSPVPTGMMGMQPDAAPAPSAEAIVHDDLFTSVESDAGVSSDP